MRGEVLFRLAAISSDMEKYSEARYHCHRKLGGMSGSRVGVEVLVLKVARVWRGLMVETYQNSMTRIFRWDEYSDMQDFVKLCKKPFQGRYHFTHKVHDLYNLYVAMKAISTTPFHSQNAKCYAKPCFTSSIPNTLPC
jgi:hypothetical protein